MGTLAGVKLRFEETMCGYLVLGEADPRKAAARDPNDRTEIRIDAKIEICDLEKFLTPSGHEAELSGTVTRGPLAKQSVMSDGCFELFSADPNTGMRQMRYSFRFAGADGQPCFFQGEKHIKHDPGEMDVVEDMTRLFTVVYEGDDADAPPIGAGELRFKLRDAPSLVASMDVVGETSFWTRMAARVAFRSFVYGALRDEYLKGLRVVYDTEYQNLVLSGFVSGDEGPRPFFLISGVHADGFPWGDGETFSDVILAIEEGDGRYQRYCITNRALEGMSLDVEGGAYRYRGPLFAITEGHAASFSQMRKGACHLVECQADLEIAFDARQHGTVSYPYPVRGRWLASLRAKLRDALPSEHPLGMHITPHWVTVRSGKLGITRPAPDGDGQATMHEVTIDADRTVGEAERSDFRNIKEPTLLYGYICAVLRDRQCARVQIHSRTLRDERELWAKDQLDKFVGKVLSRIASAEMLVTPGGLGVEGLAPRKKDDRGRKLFAKLGEPVIDVNNDHYPTGDFHRRIITVRDPSGEQCLALEEDMSLMRLEAMSSNKTATVAAIRDQDKLAALDRVLGETGFDEVIQEHCGKVEKDEKTLSIVIKPNFMFAYDRNDPSTYTDPQLVGHLVKRLQSRGFRKIAVVEAQSTYGEYFDKRSVREMAQYLGYEKAVPCDIIDLTEDARGHEHSFGPHLGRHPVSPTWRDADFRISFAKNKTHAYAYYTLTLKNIYGALPQANKFKEYHCDRDIYETTMEYLAAFPVHFGLVDAHLSADGPFGIFADISPNPTHTIIGGRDLVAVDWVAASKMGVDPMLSEYMRLAVSRFGKPAIDLVGDASPYRPWLNVPVGLTLFTHKGLDANYHFGNLFYSACSQMDKTHFTHKSRAPLVRLLRALTNPVRRAIFLRTGERPSLGNRSASWLFDKLGY